jgi:hypothetical protein
VIECPECGKRVFRVDVIGVVRFTLNDDGSLATINAPEEFVPFGDFDDRACDACGWNPHSVESGNLDEKVHNAATHVAGRIEGKVKR